MSEDVNVHGYRDDALRKEMRCNLERLKSVLFDGLDDSCSVVQKNESMRRAWGYAEACLACLAHVKNAEEKMSVGGYER